MERNINGKEYADCIHFSAHGKMTFWTRLQLLFSPGNFDYSVEIFTENLPGSTFSTNGFMRTAEFSDWFPRKNIGMEAPMENTEA